MRARWTVSLRREACPTRLLFFFFCCWRRCEGGCGAVPTLRRTMADKPLDNPALGEPIGKPTTKLGILKIDLDAAKGTLEDIRKQETAFEQQEQKGGAPVLDPSVFKRPLSARGAPSMEQLHEAGVYRKAKKPAIRGQVVEDGSVGWETMHDMLTGIRVVVRNKMRSSICRVHRLC